MSEELAPWERHNVVVSAFAAALIRVFRDPVDRLIALESLTLGILTSISHDETVVKDMLEDCAEGVLKRLRDGKVDYN